MPHMKSGRQGRGHKKGSTISKILTRGPNKGKSVTFRVARGGKVFPIRRGGKKI